MRDSRCLLVAMLGLGGCMFGADAGVLARETTPRGGSLTMRLGTGAGGMSTERYFAGLDLADVRLDLASGGTRLTGGASVVGGVRVAGPAYIDARIGVWSPIASTVDDAVAVPTFEIGGYVPLREFQGGMRGEGADGVTFGLRADADNSTYITAFIGYTYFVVPGY